MAKKIPQINASSMADISFLLLIFFLVTTSMDVNQGLARRLPAPIPPDQKIEDKDINKRNLLVVKINSANQLMVQGQLMDVKQLRERAKEFIKNENNAANALRNSLRTRITRTTIRKCSKRISVLRSVSLSTPRTT